MKRRHIDYPSGPANFFVKPSPVFVEDSHGVTELVCSFHARHTPKMTYLRPLATWLYEQRVCLMGAG